MGLAGGMNLYGFAGGDPVNFADPFGLCPDRNGKELPEKVCHPDDKPLETPLVDPVAIAAGGLAGGLLAPLTSVVEDAAASEIDAAELKLSKTVADHLSDVGKTGTKARPYGDSRLVMREIMKAGKPVADPGGVPGALRWDVPGAVGKSSGMWQLVVDPRTQMVLHFLFTSVP